MAGKILIIDDDPHAAKVAERALTQAGFSCTVSHQAIGTNQLILQLKPDLLLLDVMMPSLFGDTLAEIISSGHTARPKIVYYSNKSAAELKKLVAKTRVEGFVCKTDGPAALVEKIKGLVE